MAKRAEEAHAAGQPFAIDLYSGASTGDAIDGVLTKANAIRRAASAYLRQCRVAGEVAFDLLAVDVFPDGNYDVRFVQDAVEFGW